MLSVIALALMVGCGNSPTAIDANKDGELVEEVDEDPPVIVHTPIEGTQTFGADVSIQATVTDEGTGVQFVTLYYKNEIDDSDAWEGKIMIASGDVYTQTIPGADHHGGGIDYYIEAVDRSQNTSYSPDEGASDPYHFRIAE